VQLSYPTFTSYYASTHLDKCGTLFTGGTTIVTNLLLVG
jgi:hypothetical protein